MPKKKCQTFTDSKHKKMCGLPARKRYKDFGLTFLVCEKCAKSYEDKYLFNI